VTADGTPWLAMELVDGEPIDAWCARRALDARGIVALFLQVCEAVAYAHRNLVVHRDLKPGNVFVDREGRVRLLDFGVAKLLDDRAVEATATRVLTPGYGAPEQLTGRGVTTATDVYGMGAVLYRLLAGRLPFAAGEASPPGAAATPPRPSSAPGAVAAIDADLDNAVLMALRPEADRRYPTAEALRDDLQRWLEGRALQATPDSAAYRLRKYAVRHRKVAVAAVLAVTGLLGGSALALWQAAVARDEARRAQAAATEAERQLRRAEEVTRFLVDTFAAADPEVTGGREVTAEEIVTEGVRRIRRELTAQPAVRHQLLSVLGEITYRLGDLARAEELLAEALALGGTTAAERSHDLRLAAMAASGRGDEEEAARRFARALEQAEREEVPATQRVALELSYAVHLTNRERSDEAEQRLRRLIASPWFAQAGGAARGTAMFTLGQALAARGRFEEARRFAGGSLGEFTRELGERHPEVAAAHSILAGIEASLGRLAEAEALERRAVAIHLEVHGPGHYRTLLAQNNLATYLKSAGRFAASAELLAEVLAAQQQALGPDHPFVASTYFNLGEARLLDGDLRGALAAYRRAVEMADANPTALASRRGIFHAIHGRALAAAGEVASAEAEFARGRALLAELPGPAHPLTARVAVEYAGFLNDRRREAEALHLARDALPILAAAYGEGSRELALARLQLGRALLSSEPAAARAALRQAGDALAASPFRAQYRAQIEQAAALLSTAAPPSPAAQRSQP
jgi:serine/threonine-protein kinase